MAARTVTPDPNVPKKGAGTTFWRLKDGQEITALADYTDDTKWERLSQIKEFSSGALTASDEEDNYLDDPDADWTKTSPGQKSAGTTTITIVWKPGETSQKKLIQDFYNDVVTYYRAKYPNGAVDVYRGYINNLEKTTTFNEKMTRSVTIMNVGKPKLAEELLTEAAAGGAG